MSNTIQHIEHDIEKVLYISDAELFADKINHTDDGIYCLLLLGAKELFDLDTELIDPKKNNINSPIEKIVLDCMQNANATALYSDIIINNGKFSFAEMYPSYFSGLLNSGLIIQSPIFVKNNSRLKLQYNPNIEVLHYYNYLRQIETNHKVLHIPEYLYSISINSKMISDIGEDLKILND